ncbi:MAG: hypothetical protein K0Q64_1067 [Nitrobacter vulgaris]|jgi:hypothetical protein|nr:hypothetical protein [Nitrobacter vulgaris]
MPTEPEYRISYEIYAMVSGERVILHGGIFPKFDAMKLLRDEQRLLSQGRYAPEVSEIGWSRVEWSEATGR